MNKQQSTSKSKNVGATTGLQGGMKVVPYAHIEFFKKGNHLVTVDHCPLFSRS